MRVLYVSQNGMLEGLGQSQVLGYLRGLAQKGVDIDLISYELADASDADLDDERSRIERAGINWHPLRRARDPRLRVKVAESGRGVAHALKIALRRQPRIIHGRSTLATAVADLVATTLPRSRLLFDCRGMLGDEYVDAGYWTEDRLEYRLVKHYERRAFRRADGVVVLTSALRRWLEESGTLGSRPRVAVIPCCADLNRFSFDQTARARARAELGLGDAFTLVYAGSLGSASGGSFYREADMARFARIVAARAGRKVRFLLLTPSKPDVFLGHLHREGFPVEDVIVRRVAPHDMPSYLSGGDLALSFIMSAFSKMGSSPTKVAEYLGCGMPVVLNGDIGDQRALAAEVEACVVLDSFADEDLERAADRGLALAQRPLDERTSKSRRAARAHFDLETVGVARYLALYEDIAAR